MQPSTLTSSWVAKRAARCITLLGMVTPNRNHRVSDTVYNAAASQADEDGITVTDVVVACLAAYGGTDARPAGVQLATAIRRALGIDRRTHTGE